MLVPSLLLFRQTPRNTFHFMAWIYWNSCSKVTVLRRKWKYIQRGQRKALPQGRSLAVCGPIHSPSFRLNACHNPSITYSLIKFTLLTIWDALQESSWLLATRRASRHSTVFEYINSLPRIAFVTRGLRKLDILRTVLRPKCTVYSEQFQTEAHRCVSPTNASRARERAPPPFRPRPPPPRRTLGCPLRSSCPFLLAYT